MKQVCIMICILVLFSCTKKDSWNKGLSDDEIKSGTVEKEENGGFGGSVCSSGNSGSQPITEVSSVNSYVCDSIPTPGTWYIKQNYLNAYQHFYQMDAKPEYPGSVLCGPTSYMLGAHMIASTKGAIYPSTKAKLGAVYGKLKSFGKFDDALGMYIGDLQWFASNYDYPIVKTSYKRTSERSLMKEYIEYNIKNGYPVIVTVQIYGTHNSTWALNDADMYDQVGDSYYVSKNGPVGHYIILIGIKINADGSGTVWYKDPLSKTGATQSASYTRILDAMKYNGNNDYYDAVALFEGDMKTPSQRFFLS